MSHDRTVCGVEEPVIERETVLDAVGRLKDAVVYVESSSGTPPLKGKKEHRSVLFDQQNCSFVPRVAAAPLGSRLMFRNSDPVLHNVHALLGGKTIANFAMPIQGQEITALSIEKPGEIDLRCDAGHEWMKAYLIALPHTYFFVTGADGAYRIEHLPKGRYRLIAWHPDLGRIERPLEISGDNAVISADLRY